MTSSTKIYSMMLISIIMTSLLMLSFLGIFHSLSMQNMTTMTGDCLFTFLQLAAPSRNMDHVMLWHGLISSFANTAVTVSLLTLSLVLLSAVFLKRHFFLTTAQQAVAHKLYRIRYPSVHLFDPLRLLFSQGILHPKIFLS